MNISEKAVATCINALDILVENSEETVVCIVGPCHYDYLKQVVADGPTDKIDAFEIGEIQEFIDRREALAELKEKLTVHQRGPVFDGSYCDVSEKERQAYNNGVLAGHYDPEAKLLVKKPDLHK